MSGESEFEGLGELRSSFRGLSDPSRIAADDFDSLNWTDTLVVLSLEWTERFYPLLGLAPDAFPTIRRAGLHYQQRSRTMLEGWPEFEAHIQQGDLSPDELKYRDAPEWAWQLVAKRDLVQDELQTLMSSDVGIVIRLRELEFLGRCRDDFAWTRMLDRALQESLNLATLLPPVGAASIGQIGAAWRRLCAGDFAQIDDEVEERAVGEADREFLDRFGGDSVEASVESSVSDVIGRLELDALVRFWQVVWPILGEGGARQFASRLMTRFAWYVEGAGVPSVPPMVLQMYR